MADQAAAGRAGDPNRDKSHSQVPAHVELKVNGKEIPLSDFVQRFMRGALCGMVQSLRGVEDVRTVELKLMHDL